MDLATEKERLLREGWSEPPPDLDDGAVLVGYRVFVDGYGEGKVVQFNKSRIPGRASAHTIEFQGAGEASTTERIQPVSYTHLTLPTKA